MKNNKPVFTVETSEKQSTCFHSENKWNKAAEERSMPLEEQKSEICEQTIFFEFTPFTKEHLVRYLRNSLVQTRYLQERQDSLYKQLRDLDKKKAVNGQTIDERIQMFAYGSHSGDESGSGGSGNRYNPDTLFNRWVKIYEPYETHRKVLTGSILKILYKQWQLECVNQCVDQLEPRQRDVILRVYVRHEKVLPYCQSEQIGHNSYNKLKDRALDSLLISCNESLANLQKNWEGINAETVRISDYIPRRGWSARSRACI